MQLLHKSLAWLSLLLLLPQTTSTQPVANKTPILAHVNGTNATELSFKILQLADLHFSGDPTFACQDPPSNLRREDSPCTEALTSKFIDELLDLEKPDFVVFTGDNVQTFSDENHQRAVDAFTKGAEERGIPFAVVLGNHDDENGFPREQIMEMVMQKSHSYAQRGPRTVDGVGNYQLSVKAPIDGPWGNASDSVFNMYFLDSGGYPDRQKYPDVTSTYDWIKSTQVEYYRNLSLAAQNEACKNKNSASADTIAVPTSATSKDPLPAVMFFHIPLQEYEFSTVDRYQRTGDANEQVMASGVHSELFSALVERNEVKATFVGHDHINEYCYNRQGVQLCYGGGAGFGVAYGSSDFPRRARVIEWSVDRNNERTIKSWRRLYGQMESKYGEEVLFTQNTQGRVGLAVGDDSDETSASSSALRTNVVSLLLGMLLLSLGML